MFDLQQKHAKKTTMKNEISRDMLSNPIPRQINVERHVRVRR